MAVYRYRTEIAGRVRVGLEFDSDAELENFLLGRGIDTRLGSDDPASSRAMLDADRSEQADHASAPGRPSFTAAIASAVAAIGAPAFDPAVPQAKRARLIQRHIVHAGDREPSLGVIKAFLRAQKKEQSKTKSKIRSKTRAA